MTSRTMDVYDKDTHILRLEEINKALSEKLSFLNKRMMSRNSEQSIKWQNKCFYWKRKYLTLCERLVTLGLGNVLKSDNQGDGNGKVCNLSGEETGR